MVNVIQKLNIKNANIWLFLTACAALLAGYISMSTQVGDYNLEFVNLTLAPVFLLIAFVLFGFSIFTFDSRVNRHYIRENLLVLTGGILVFTISLGIYAHTVEPTTSFWDCGEFLSAASKLEIPHSPGAPLYLLIGRVFSLFAFTKQDIALCVNMVSALASAVTVLILYYTIILLLKRQKNKPYLNNKYRTSITTIISLAASLTFAFSDSFWFNAVEAEVYALSCLFTALVFWSMLRWQASQNTNSERRWLIFIAYLIGLSIGVHLLNLVIFPVLVIQYYLKKFSFTYTGLFTSGLIGIAGVFVLMNGVVTGLPALAGDLEVFVVNELNFSFGSGALIFIAFSLLFILLGFIYAIKNNKNTFLTLLVCTVFLFIGFSSYLTILIRSGFNPPLDENNPENVLSLISYLRRDQYGSRPLLKGPLFTTKYPEQVVKGELKYCKDETLQKYVSYDAHYKYIYSEKDQMLFPRIYSNTANHAAFYRKWSKIPAGKNPTMGDNLNFFFTYQLGHMYLRYFLWNFSGRESNLQDAGSIDFQEIWNSSIPSFMQENKGRNNYYFFPLILGILGMIYHFLNHKRDMLVIFLFFFFTGLAVVIYLNQPPQEPRERDYVYVGSFYAFAIWIAFGFSFLVDFIFNLFKKSWTLYFTLSLPFCVPALLLAENWNDHNRSGRYFAADSAKNVLSACAPNAILFTAADNDTFPLWYLQEVEEYRTDVRICCLSLLNTDWYIDAMLRWSNKSQPLPISFTYKEYVNGKHDQIYIDKDPRFLTGVDLVQYLILLKQENSITQHPNFPDHSVSVLPSQKIRLKVGSSNYFQNSCNPSNKVSPVRSMVFEMKSHLTKSQLMVLDIIATNEWKRPIYFNSSSIHEHAYLEKYTQKEGFIMRLLPINFDENGSRCNSEKMYTNLMKRSSWRGLNDKNVCNDNAGMPFIIQSRTEFGELATKLIQEGNFNKAIKVLDHSLNSIPDHSIPYNYGNISYPSLLYKLGKIKTAREISLKMANDCVSQLDYYSVKQDDYNMEYNLYLLQQLIAIFESIEMKEPAAQFHKVFIKYYENFIANHENFTE